MVRTTIFDTLVVYSNKLSYSAVATSESINAPFSGKYINEGYNLVYSYFLKNCQKNNLKVAFTTSADIVGAGKCKSYWLYNNDTWMKVQEAGFSKLIFDKFSPKSESRKIQRDLLFSSKRIKPFNDISLFELCFDKQKTYEALKNFSLPTVTIRGKTREDVIKAQNSLKEKIAKYKNRNDFSKEVIIKDRFGAGGLNVYKFDIDQTELMVDLIKRHKSISFIIQPFVKMDKGFSFQNSFNPTEIRLIYLGQKIIQTYIRVANKGEFRCNEHLGGKLKYINKRELPLEIREVSKKIVNILNKKNSLYALDYIISNNGNVYLLEANTGPGLDWNLAVKENEIEAKKLIRIIVKEIEKRVTLSKNNSLKKVVIPARDVPSVVKYQYPHII